MSAYLRGWKYLFIASVITLMAGCANTKVVYKPSAPVAGALKLPWKLAVLPFKDGTENFTTRGSVLNYTKIYNLAKTGSSYTAVAAKPPIVWAKEFADALSVSGNFQSVRFFYSPSELTNEEFFVEGTVFKAYYNSENYKTNEFAVSFQARQRVDNQIVWEKEVTRAWQLQEDYIDEKIVLVIQDMFAEARADLVRTLAAQPGSRDKNGGSHSAAYPQSLDSESVDVDIERIFNGK